MNELELKTEWINICHKIKDLEYWILKYPDVQSYKADLQHAKDEEEKLRIKLTALIKSDKDEDSEGD